MFLDVLCPDLCTIQFSPKMSPSGKIFLTNLPEQSPLLHSYFIRFVARIAI